MASEDRSLFKFIHLGERLLQEASNWQEEFDDRKADTGKNSKQHP